MKDSTLYEWIRDLSKHNYNLIKIRLIFLKKKKKKFHCKRREKKQSQGQKPRDITKRPRQQNTLI
jgi:hypothetical protein